jgi:hypothetical protein
MLPIDHKRSIYLYLQFDGRNYGYFYIDKFLEEILQDRKPKIVVKENKFLIETDEIFACIRSHMQK